ncbi:MAG: hypothetical protein AAF842_07605 [Planctomycetota bacterium]
MTRPRWVKPVAISLAIVVLYGLVAAAIGWFVADRPERFIVVTDFIRGASDGAFEAEVMWGENDERGLVRWAVVSLGEPKRRTILSWSGDLEYRFGARPGPKVSLSEASSDQACLIYVARGHETLLFEVDRLSIDEWQKCLFEWRVDDPRAISSLMSAINAVEIDSSVLHDAE